MAHDQLAWGFWRPTSLVVNCPMENCDGLWIGCEMDSGPGVFPIKGGGVSWA